MPWVAALDNGRLSGLEIDPPNERVRWGAIYWARVARIDKSLDAAFIELDESGTMGFLNNADVYITREDGRIVKGGREAIGTVLHPGQMIPVQAKSACLTQGPEDGNTEDKMESKLPRMSMNITLPGRFLIYAPKMTTNRISQRIRDKQTRKQLVKMLDVLEMMDGFILRAAAAHTQTDILIREAKILREMWLRLSDFFEGEAPALIMEGPGALERSVSDQAMNRIENIDVTTMDDFSKAEEWCEIFAPDLVTKIRAVKTNDNTADLSLFDFRDVLDQIRALAGPVALLPSGGNLIIEKTAALTAVDVNRGKDKSPNIAVNIEAGHEIARQLRLRNLGGTIMIDFLKLKSKKDEGRLIAEMERAFNNDPCTVSIYGMTSLGLMEISRSRRTPPLIDRLPLAEL